MEFIVWDKENKIFLDENYEDIIFKKELDQNRDILYKGDEQYPVSDMDFILGYTDSLVRYKDRLTTHQYIGKTDTKGNKIYADCSIVEFLYKGEKITETSHKEERGVGFFTYNENKLAYEIISILCEKVFTFVQMEIKDIKIIDTLQENKLGLIE